MNIPIDRGGRSEPLHNGKLSASDSRAPDSGAPASRARSGLLLCSLAALGLLVGACGAADESADESAMDAEGGVQADGGFSDEGPADSATGAVAALRSGKAADVTAADSAMEEAGSATADSAMEEAGSATADSAMEEADSIEADFIEADFDENSPQRKLTGGSIDDNERFDDYLAYRARIKGLGIAVRDLDPSGRIIVTVTGQGGLPAAGAEVAFSGGGVQAVLRTTADGTVRFHPEAHRAAAGPFTITAGGAITQASRGDSVAINTELPTAGSGSAIPLDILYLLDATGSMGDEIDQLKATITEVAQRVSQLSAEVDVRLAMTLYRDEGDAFVTSTHDFTSDVVAFAAALADVEADGGGDYPEALDEALAEALAKPAWRPPANTLQLIFLVADAPPQVNRQVQTPYTTSMLEAAGRGVKILPISSSGTDDQAEYVFRQLAQFTGGRYVFLTYGAEGKGAATGTATDITQLDYEDLSLDDLIVRLIAEEVAALTNSDAATPAPAPTPGSGQTTPQDPPPQQQPAPAPAETSEDPGGS